MRAYPIPDFRGQVIGSVPEFDCTRAQERRQGLQLLSALLYQQDSGSDAPDEAERAPSRLPVEAILLRHACSYWPAVGKAHSKGRGWTASNLVQRQPHTRGMVRVARGQHFAYCEPGLDVNPPHLQLPSLEVDMSLAEFVTRSQSWYPPLQRLNLLGPSLLCTHPWWLVQARPIGPLPR